MKECKNIDFDQKLVSKHDLPVYGKHILFTSPRNYAALLGDLLIQRGARPVWMPTIEIWPMPDYGELDRVILSLSDYDWVAFTSENGVEPFCKRFQSLGLDPGAVKNTRLAAFTADSILLEKNGVKVDLVPEEMSPRGIVDELVRSGVNSGRVLVPCPHVSGVKEPYVVPEFIKSLESIGMTADRLEVYSTVALRDNKKIERNMLLNGEIDIIVFTSSAEIFSLLDQIDKAKEVLNQYTIAYMGTFTAKTGTEAGLNVDIVPKKFTMRSLLEAMEAHCRD